MAKNNPVSPIYRFKEDPIHALILETMSKKPVNSDHFSLVKRIKLSDYTKRPVTTDNLDTVGKRSREYMAEAGFAYGRLKQTNLSSDPIKNNIVRIHAPGPVRNKIMDEENQDQKEFNDDFQSKTISGFQKVKIAPMEKNSKNTKYSKVLENLTLPNTRISASQRQAREYLNYLNALNLNEHSFIHSQIVQKTKELEENIENESKKQETKLNSRGIFSTEFNKERVISMMPVKMLSQLKITVEPIVREAKSLVMKEKVKEWQYNPFGNPKAETNKSLKNRRKTRLLDIVEQTISKKSTKVKKKEITVLAKQKIKLNWVDRLNQTMTFVKEKCKPDERISNMEAL
jgi:hypothetical protein